MPEASFGFGDGAGSSDQSTKRPNVAQFLEFAAFPIVSHRPQRCAKAQTLRLNT